MTAYVAFVTAACLIAAAVSIVVTWTVLQVRWLLVRRHLLREFERDAEVFANAHGYTFRGDILTRLEVSDE